MWHVRLEKRKKVVEYLLIIKTLAWESGLITEISSSLQKMLTSVPCGMDYKSLLEMLPYLEHALWGQWCNYPSQQRRKLRLREVYVIQCCDWVSNQGLLATGVCLFWLHYFCSLILTHPSEQSFLTGVPHLNHRMYKMVWMAIISIFPRIHLVSTF